MEKTLSIQAIHPKKNNGIGTSDDDLTPPSPPKRRRGERNMMF